MAITKIRNFQVTIGSSNVEQPILDGTRSVQSNTLLIQAHSSNTTTMFYGEEGSQLGELQPGQSLSLEGVLDPDGSGQLSYGTSLIFIKSETVGDKVTITYVEVL